MATSDLLGAGGAAEDYNPNATTNPNAVPKLGAAGTAAANATSAGENIDLLLL